ncbi:MAG: hydantoinase/oxoprolinase family protein [Alphaproteobacteria bacterium]|jgi:N-methylhydantoinase A|nr:hydantoinase/oxoprolinase family protein [Rhodospirillaceae bacterium]MBT6508906.1 hydantoinase/oxoprolinase family protein [Rhodospirillaceae bacterium]MDG2482860.1 hydantoinase/oxoprolinase family protein [Alphaproteobacteria bacterium]
MRTLSADVGGTFTDLVLIDAEAGAVHLDKVPSTPGRADAVLSGIRRLSDQAGIAPGEIDIFVHGFTVGTNAFLTRNGAKVAMAVTEGMRDVLEIGDQMRPHLYRLSQSKPPPVVPRSRIIQVDERRDAFGNVVTELSQDEAKRVAAELATLEPEAVAVCLGFSFLDASHEVLLENEIARALPGVPIYLSSRVNPQIEEYPRANTTAIAAYVGPVVDRYVSTLDQALAGDGVAAPLRLMRSDGGVATPQSARDNPAAMLLSGPAGGVIAGAAMAQELGVPDLVTFDMGGTSADFSVIAASEPRMVTERHIDGQPLRLPTLDIETISAGGGSIAHVDLGGGLRVGPQSAGAEPGPACYGQGGTDATVTDAAVVLGILHPGEFLGGEIPLDAGLARDAVRKNVAEPLGLSLEAAALGIVRVASAGMIQAIRKLSVERGLDIRDFALLAFGGAGPIYAPFMARDLDMAEVLVPLNPGVYAAQGLLMSDIRHTTQTAFQRRFVKVEEAELTERLTTLRNELDQALGRDGIAAGDRRFRFLADMRCSGQFHELLVPLPEPGAQGWWQPEAVAATFHEHHEKAYGHTDSEAPVEFVNLRVEGFGRTTKAALPTAGTQVSETPEPASHRPVCLDVDEGYHDTPVYHRADLQPGHALAGPAVIIQRDTTTVVLGGQHATVTDGGVIRIGVGT